MVGNSIHLSERLEALYNDIQLEQNSFYLQQDIEMTTAKVLTFRPPRPLNPLAKTTIPLCITRQYSTEKYSIAYQYIKDYIRQHSGAPTQAEIAEHMNLTQGKIFVLLDKMLNAGLIQKSAHIKRSILITDLDEQKVNEKLDELSKKRPYAKNRSLKWK